MSERHEHDLHEAMAYWTEPYDEEAQLTEDQQLARFLETLEKSGPRPHDAAVGDCANAVGRRSAPRLRLSLPARFVAVERTHRCILLNLSRSGALIAILDSLREGESGFLHCGSLSAFTTVTRSEFSLNALQFEDGIGHEDVLDIRRYYETFEERERRQLIETARRWVSGESADERAI
jgi:hypothetical protein